MTVELTELVQGDSYEWDVTITHGEDAVDISGWKMSCTIKRALTDTDADALLKVDYTFPTDAQSALGLGTFTLPAADTELVLSGKNYWMDMQIVMTDRTPVGVKTLFIKKINVIADVTNRVPA